MIDAFVTYIQAEKRYSALTVRNYRHDIESFVAWCASSAGQSPEEFDVCSVTAEDIREWMVHRIVTGKVDKKGKRSELNPATINRELSSLRSFYRYLRREGHMTKDIFARISAQRAPSRLPSFVPETRMEQLLDNIREQSHEGEFKKQRDGLIVALFYGCGIRLAELQGVLLGDFSADFASLRVRGKGGKHRIIPLHSELSARARAYINRLRDKEFATTADAPLIVNSKGKPLSRSTIQSVVRSKLTAAEVQGKKSPHILRHTFATHLLNKGADMRVIQELMGHSSLRTTQCYTHNSIAQLQRVYAEAHPHK